MRITAGSTLLEVAVYLAAGSVLILVTARASLAWYAQMRAMQQNLTRQVSLAAGFDLLRRDIQQAPSDPTLWITQSPHKIAWHEKDKTRHAYEWVNKQLIRMERRYNWTHNFFEQKIKSLVINDVEKCAFTFVVDQNQVRAVRCSLVAQNVPYEKIVFVQAGAMIS